MRLLLAPFLFLALLLPVAQAAEEYSYWIEPCTEAAAKATRCAATDTELARWAIEAWQRESGGSIVFRPAPGEQAARIRIHWAGGGDSLYGETQRIQVNGKPGANIYVLPDIRALGLDVWAVSQRDALFREAIVYLTCLHESGHAIGLAHTRNFADIMYSFGYGGDVVEYFQRYRRQLRQRSDIAGHAGISDADRSVLHSLPEAL
jgi:hypothetical protein